MHVIRATIGDFAKTINALADEGHIKPCEFVITHPNGFEELHRANSVWAATDWLKTNGYYDGKDYNVKWNFNPPADFMSED